jgi:hypothetical protein
MGGKVVVSTVATVVVVMVLKCARKPEGFQGGLSVIVAETFIYLTVWLQALRDIMIY